MSEIYLIRHGQASFGEEVYDKLSPMGIRQARVLARHLARLNPSFDMVYCGTMERQRVTAQEVLGSLWGTPERGSQRKICRLSLIVSGAATGRAPMLAGRAVV